jgi:hypothetical protein
MAITKGDFTKLYNDTHRQLTGVPAAMEVVQENYEKLIVLIRLSGSDEGVPIFSNTRDKAGNLNWTYWPKPV